jgi:hypothetical protein
MEISILEEWITRLEALEWDLNYQIHVIDDMKKTLEDIKQTSKTYSSEQVDENQRNLYFKKQVMNPYPVEDHSYSAYEKGFMEGYQEAVKLQSGKIYSEEDMKLCYMQGWNRGKDGDSTQMNSYLKSLGNIKQE